MVSLFAIQFPTLIAVCPTLRPRARLTIVLKPFVALRHDVVRRCEGANIKCKVYNGDRTSTLSMFPDVGVLVVAAEHVGLPSFKAMLTRLSS